MLDLAEIKTLLSVMENLKHRALLTITYSAGLRVSEAAKLKVTDIDGKRDGTCATGQGEEGPL